MFSQIRASLNTLYHSFVDSAPTSAPAVRGGLASQFIATQNPINRAGDSLSSPFSRAGNYLRSLPSPNLANVAVGLGALAVGALVFASTKNAGLASRAVLVIGPMLLAGCASAASNISVPDAAPASICEESQVQGEVRRDGSPTVPCNIHIQIQRPAGSTARYAAVTRGIPIPPVEVLDFFELSEGVTERQYPYTASSVVNGFHVLLYNEVPRFTEMTRGGIVRPYLDWDNNVLACAGWNQEVSEDREDRLCR